MSMSTDKAAIGLKITASMVPVEGIEPTLSCLNRILSPTRLPVPPHRPML